MPKALTAEDLFFNMQSLPNRERVRFFTMLGTKAFQSQSGTHSHDEVFGDLAKVNFTAAQAAEYLEMSMATFRRYVQGGKIHPVQVIGRNQFFVGKDLKLFKRALKDVQRKRSAD
jgi:hypothetical protein